MPKNLPRHRTPPFLLHWRFQSRTLLQLFGPRDTLFDVVDLKKEESNNPTLLPNGVSWLSYHFGTLGVSHVFSHNVGSPIALVQRLWMMGNISITWCHLGSANNSSNRIIAWPIIGRFVPRKMILVSVWQGGTPRLECACHRRPHQCVAKSFLSCGFFYESVKHLERMLVGEGVHFHMIVSRIQSNTPVLIAKVGGSLHHLNVPWTL